MIECLQNQGFGFYAERQDFGVRSDAEVHHDTGPVAKQRRDIPCPLPLPDTLAGSRAQVICRIFPAKLMRTRSRRRLLPGLMVGINRCRYWGKLIVPGACAVI